jgi:sugar phosphate permease
MLADLFPAGDRGRVYAVLNMAIPVGSALGFILGGMIGQDYGWRHAFFVAGAPGLVLAIAVLWLKDPPRGAQDAPVARTGTATTAPVGPVAMYGSLLQRWPYMLVVLGYAAYTFALGGLAYWMPSFLERVRGVPIKEASVSFGEIVVITGFLGTFAGGWLSDYLLRYSRQAYLWFSGCVTVLAAPAAYLALAAAAPAVYMPAIVIAELLLFMSTGPINAAIVNVVSPLERASAVALSMFTIHLLGDVPSPVLIGYISDTMGSLAHAVLIVPVAVLAGGIIWLIAARVNGRTVAGT